MEREHQNEEICHPDIFIRKKILPEEIKQELEILKSAFEDEKRKMIDLSQSTYEVVKEGHGTILMLIKSLFLNNKLEALTSDASRREEDADASRVEFGPETSDKLLLLQQELVASTLDANRGKKDLDASRVEFSPETCGQAVEFYKKWVEELKKNATKRQEAVRDSVEACFELLHRFDEEEKEGPQPKQSVSENPMNKYIYSLSVLVLFVACILFIFQDYDLLKCLREITLQKQ